jgi:hypothetical protein
MISLNTYACVLDRAGPGPQVWNADVAGNGRYCKMCKIEKIMYRLIHKLLDVPGPQVLSVLLQVMDDGRLTDGQGRVVDFKNTV